MANETKIEFIERNGNTCAVCRVVTGDNDLRVLRQTAVAHGIDLMYAERRIGLRKQRCAMDISGGVKQFGENEVFSISLDKPISEVVVVREEPEVAVEPEVVEEIEAEEVVSHQDEVDSLEAVIAILRAENARLTAEIARKDEEIAQLNGQLADRPENKYLDEVLAIIDKVQDNVRDEFKEHIGELQGEVLSLNTQLEEKDKVAEKLTENIATLTEKIDGLQKKADAFTAFKKTLLALEE